MISTIIYMIVYPEAFSDTYSSLMHNLPLCNNTHFPHQLFPLRTLDLRFPSCHPSFRQPLCDVTVPHNFQPEQKNVNGEIG